MKPKNKTKAKVSGGQDPTLGDKQEYWREKRKTVYYPQEKKTVKRVNLSLSKKAYAQLSKKASGEGLRPTAYAREIVLAHLCQRTLPIDAKALEKLTVEVNSIGNNINQVIHSLHALRAYSDRKRYEELLYFVRRYQNAITAYLSKPVDLLKAVEGVLSDDPAFSKELDKLLKLYRKKKDKKAKR